jgi:alpha-tubulin suppressor-like RCC1 family protein
VVYCWGANAYGQLGDGTRSIKTSPTAVSLDYLDEIRDLLLIGGWLKNAHDHA